MKKIFIIFIFTSFTSIAQEKSDWNLLFESGINEVNTTKKINFGIGAEYYFIRQNSITIRVKYLQNGIDYSKSSNGCNSFAGFFCSPSERLKYKSKVLKIPLNYKYESSLFLENFKFFIASGFALNITLQEEFTEVKNMTPVENKTHINFNISAGILFELSKEIQLYIFPETYFFGNSKSEETIGGFFSFSKAAPKEILLGFGLRYRL